MRDKINKLLYANNVEDVWNIFTRIVADLGYQNVFYAARRFADMPRMWLAEDLEWYSNYPADFQAEQIRDGLLHASPWINWARQNSGMRSADWINTPAAAQYMTPKGAEVLACCERHGVLAGQIVSQLGLSARVTGTVGLNPFVGATQAQADETWKKSGADITTLCAIMHLRINALPRTKGAGVLTTRQREVIEWAAYGKTIVEIAEILGVTPATVEKHLRLAREALGVHSTAQAVLKAHIKNQIFVEEPVRYKAR